MGNLKYGLALAPAIFAVRCSDTAAGPVDGITVSVIAAEANQAAMGGRASGAVQIDALRLVLGGVKLETAGLDGTVDWLMSESRVVELDLSGEPVTAHALLDVPAGTYKEVEISIDKLEPGNAAEEPLIAEHPDLTDASIVVTGRVQQDGGDRPFTFTAALDRDMEILLEPVLVVAGGGEATGLRLTLTLRTAGWFYSSSGGWLDPRDPANRSSIETANATDLFPRLLGASYAMLGETDEAVRWLRIAADHGFINYPYIARHDPLLNNLRTDRQSHDLLEDVRRRWESFEV